MFHKILKYLEDTEHPCLGPHLRLLGLTGLWHHVIARVTRIKLTFLYLTVLFFFTQYIKCIVFFSTDSLKLILQYAPFHMGIVKICFFRKHHDIWYQLIKYISNVERLQIEDISIRRLTDDYIKRSRRVTYFFWALAFFSNLSIFSEPYLKNQEVEGAYVYIFDGYTPFNRGPPGYYCSMFIQTVLGHIVSACVVGWEDIQSVQHQKIFNSLISSVMFVYLVVISVNLGVCIIQIVELKNDISTLISAAMFLMACLIQLLIFYWHGNEVTNESLFVSHGPFKSNWVGADNTVQREVSLLIATTNRRLIFKAGPFNEMSLSTFVSILRTSYSFFTLLNETTQI